MRIISLVPSFTELLFDLNLGDSVVGVTRFCIHPKQKTKLITKVGGTKNVKLDIIKQLNPDLIIANKEENQKEDIEALQKEHTVWLTEITTIKDALGMILALGSKTQRERESKLLVQEIESQFKTIVIPNPTITKTVAYFIWQSPYMLAGRNTFINQLITAIGFTNIISGTDARYPVLSGQEIQELKPDYIFLSSEPFPFKEVNKDEFQALFPFSKVVLVDGEMFSWYGSRMKLAASYFNTLILKL